MEFDGIRKLYGGNSTMSHPTFSFSTSTTVNLIDNADSPRHRTPYLIDLLSYAYFNPDWKVLTTRQTSVGPGLMTGLVVPRLNDRGANVQH